jgi:hypothetical protein
MSSNELNALEREVELTRAKFADDLARLRSPESLTQFKEDLWANVRERKDGVNPIAVAALAAGVGWRLFNRPPIATLLVGLGLVGLLRTSPSPSDYANAEDLFDPGRWPARAGNMADAAKQKVQELGVQATEVARDAARDASAQIAETAASMKERASDSLRDAGGIAGARLHDARDTAQARMTHFADDAASMGHDASARLRAAMPDRADRDNILFGAAALAVAAAMGISVQRRAHEKEQRFETREGHSRSRPLG